MLGLVKGSIRKNNNKTANSVKRNSGHFISVKTNGYKINLKVCCNNYGWSQNNDHIAISTPVIPRLDRGIQKVTGCPLKTCGHDVETVMEL
jgi:hypothetical protein